METGRKLTRSFSGEKGILSALGVGPLILRSHLARRILRHAYKGRIGGMIVLFEKEVKTPKKNPSCETGVPGDFRLTRGF